MLRLPLKLSNGLWDDLQNHPERHADNAIQLLRTKRVHGRRKPPRRAGRGRQWRPLRDSFEQRDLLWHGLQNHPEWRADDPTQLLRPTKLHGRRRTLREAGPGHQWGLLRDNLWRRRQQRWHGLQNHPQWRADDSIQLLLSRRGPVYR